MTGIVGGNRIHSLTAESVVDSRVSVSMDPLYLAHSFYRRRKFEQCVIICTNLLEKNPYDQVIWQNGLSNLISSLTLT